MASIRRQKRSSVLHLHHTNLVWRRPGVTEYCTATGIPQPSGRHFSITFPQVSCNLQSDWYQEATHCQPKSLKALVSLRTILSWDCSMCRICGKARVCCSAPDVWYKDMKCGFTSLDLCAVRWSERCTSDTACACAASEKQSCWEVGSNGNKNYLQFVSCCRG
jgi:hypothetical protein